MIVAVDIETGKVLGQVPAQSGSQKGDWPDMRAGALRILTKYGYVFVLTGTVRVEEIK